MYKVALLRHGESTWNKENLFTGWTDVDLSDKGREEAKKAGSLLKKYAFEFDIVFTSVLKRCIRTTQIVLDEMDQMWVPVVKDWRLNERHYGGLQGLNKAETAAKYGEDQVHIWRRSYDVRPPLLEKTDERSVQHDRRYKDLPDDVIPYGECLEDTVKRVVPYWESVILPYIKAEKSVLVSAHGNSLRALVKHLDSISNEEIPELNIPTGIPFVYELDEQFKPIRHYYLADQEEVAQAKAEVEAQGKAS